MFMTDREVETELAQIRYYDEMGNKLLELYHALEVLEDEHDKHRDNPVDWVDPVSGEVYLSAEWSDDEDRYLSDIDDLKREIARLERELG